MRELRMLRWCDICWQENESQVEAIHTYTAGVCTGESRPSLKLVELCETHSKTLVDIQAILADIGTIPDFTTKKKAPPTVETFVRTHDTKPCPVCKIQIGSNVMVAHIWKAHRTDAKPPVPKICPECGSHQESSQGMTQHRRITHGFDAIADALSGVKKNGK